MIDDDVITRLTALHDHIAAPAVDPGADVLRGKRALRRRRGLAVTAAAAGAAAVLTIAPLVVGGTEAQDGLDQLRPDPTPAPTAPATSSAAPTLERIRTEGRVDDEQLFGAGLTVRTYVLCDGSPECSPSTDGPIRREHEQRALEVTQSGQAALFRIGNSAMTAVAPYDATTLLVMDPAPSSLDPFDPAQNSYRLVRADGTETPLRFEPEVAAPVPGPGVVLVQHAETDPDDDSMTSQLVLVVDADAGLVRALAVPPGTDARRTWGPDLDEQLWFVTFRCEVHFWTPGGTFETRSPGCSGSFDPGNLEDDGNGFTTDEYGNPGSGDLTWVDTDWFPDGWSAPGRMALLERDYVGRDDRRLILHVTLDGATTWEQVAVDDEADVPDALRELG